jgi:DNA repair exonuclease SbcCD ATPase subunit
MVEIKPDGSLIVIGGQNAQGKSSVLDSIEYALGGTSSIPSKPIRKGERKARVVVELDEIIVTRTFGEGGSKLIVSDRQGFTKPSPQALLDSLVGKLSFDPLGFIKMKPEDQLKIVRQIAGIDFSELDKEAKQKYDERTTLNREIKSLQAVVESIPKVDDVPEVELSYSNLLAEQERRNKVNGSNEKYRKELQRANEDLHDQNLYMEELREKIKNLRTEWSAAISNKEIMFDALNDLNEQCKDLEDENIEEINTQILQAEEVNKKVRSNNKRNMLIFDLDIREQRVEAIQKRLSEMTDEKLKLISSSKLPIKGLTFDETTLFYNGIPFTDQSSSAEQLRVSVAMGFAMNPKLKILLIRDGSLLDESNLKMVAEMAEKEDGQLWIERVSNGKEVSVVIEDGSVKEDRTKK